jgi:hypothetical protein
MSKAGYILGPSRITSHLSKAKPQIIKYKNSSWYKDIITYL